ncbi:MAG: hypothetical protein WA964_10730 [Ilumatobacter sp.]|uniref:hypothetical protein n=1 Tax=Ilumatobacter sp. TaxID=1967498 RepID=UPI003C713B19
MSAQVFAVIDTGTTIDDDGGRWPTAVIDAQGHPEITDLARVHAVEGIGDIATDAALLDIDTASLVPGSVEHLLALSVSITSPVTAAFVVAFALPAQREVLDAAMSEGHLVIATTDPERANAERPLWLAIDIDPPLLGEILPS